MVDLSPDVRGQVLAEAVASDIDSPPYTKAMMDGYAVNSLAGAAGSQATLRVIEEIAAGKMPTKRVGPGEAARIMTGAPLPDGADAVVMIERTEAVSANEVRILAEPKPGQHILKRGTEMKAGEVIFTPGSVISPQEFGILASVGRTSARPRCCFSSRTIARSPTRMRRRSNGSVPITSPRVLRRSSFMWTRV